MKNSNKRIYKSLLGTLAAAAMVAIAFAQDQAAPAAAVTGINLAESSEHGQYLTDQNGMALYAFLPDAQGASTCYDDCATNWPPVTVESADALPTLGEGLDQALLGTIERDDGTLQVTYNGWPLYYYLGDMEAGVTNGQGLGNNWYVLDATGATVGADGAAMPGGGEGDAGGQDGGEGQDGGGEGEGEDGGGEGEGEGEGEDGGM